MAQGGRKQRSPGILVGGTWKLSQRRNGFRFIFPDDLLVNITAKVLRAQVAGDDKAEILKHSIGSRPLTEQLGFKYE